jgi:hypothetical protein
MLHHVVGHHVRDRVRVEPHPFGSRCLDPGLTPARVGQSRRRHRGTRTEW